MKKTIVTSMILFAVVTVYIALRPPVETTETDKPAVAKAESEKSKTAKPTESATAAYRKSLSASAEDWANVNAIAAKYDPELKASEAKRDQALENPNSKRSSIAPEARAARLELDTANKAIRNKERKLWAEISLHLSKYELQEYNLKHSQTARDLRKESAWFEPSITEFLALYTYREETSDLLNSKIGGDTWRHFETIRSAQDRMIEAQIAIIISDKLDEEKQRSKSAVLEMESANMDYIRAYDRARQFVRAIMGERLDEFFAGPNAEIEKAYDKGMDQADELWASGQITDDEFETMYQKLEEEYKAAWNSEDTLTVPEGLE